MAVGDDLNRLAAQDVVYLMRSMTGGASEVFRGRLRQALSGNWVFNTFTGQNGVVGFNLGSPQQGGIWNSSESPATGIVVTINYTVYAPVMPALPPLVEFITLTTVIPPEFTD